jgi:E3 ubiquitin-protein ligase RNF14
MVTTGCFQRLWELEGGDGDDVGRGFMGGVQRPENEAPEIPPEEDFVVEEMVEDLPQPQEGGLELEVGNPDLPAVEAAPQQELQREGPLVLRINARPRAPTIPAVPDAPLAARRNGHPRPGNQNHRGFDPRPAGIRAAAPMGGQRMRPRNGRRQDPRGAEQIDEAQAEANAEAQQRWVQMFVQAALNDEEDELDSDGDEDDAMWEIPVR